MSDLKLGDWPIITDITRAGVGLRYTVKCHPDVEDFFRFNQGLTDPSIEPVENYGREWFRPRGSCDESPLMVYGLSDSLAGERGVGNLHYRLDRPGESILISRRDAHLTGIPTKTLNMSFLRLVGTSNPEGVSFVVHGVFGDDLVTEIENNITIACRELYRQYMMPLEVSVILEVQDNTKHVQHVTGVPLPGDGSGSTV